MTTEKHRQWLSQQPDRVRERRMWWAVLVGIMLLIAGCYTAKKAGKQIDRAAVEQPDVLADKFHHYFPQQPIKNVPGKPVTRTIVKTDTSGARISRKRIDSLLDANNFKDELLNHITVSKAFIDSIVDATLAGCPVFTEADSVFIHDTAYVVPGETLAELAALRLDTARMHDKIVVSANDLAGAKKTRNWLWIILAAIGIGIIGGVIYNFKTKQVI